MSSYAFPTSDQIDPLTGLPKKKKQQQAVNQAWQNAGGQQAIQQSLNQNPYSSFAGSFYGPPGSGRLPLPGMPDYKGLIEAQLAPFKLELGAQGTADAATRAAQTQRAFTLFGQVPDPDQLGPGINPDFVRSDITPATRQLAQENTDAGLSIAARQAKAFKDQVRQIKNALAARGALRSGEAGHQLQEAQGARDRADFDARDNLAQIVAGIQAGYAEAEQRRQLQLAQAAGQAETSVRQQFPYSPPATTDTGQMPSPEISAGQPPAQRDDLPPGWIGAPPPGQITGPTAPLDLAAILGTVKPPDPRTIRLPGGGGSYNSFGI